MTAWAGDSSNKALSRMPIVQRLRSRNVYVKALAQVTLSLPAPARILVYFSGRADSRTSILSLVEESVGK